MVVRSIPHVDLVVSQFVELKSYVCGTQPMDYLEEHGFAMRLIIQSDRVTARARRVVDASTRPQNTEKDLSLSGKLTVMSIPNFSFECS